MRIAVKSLTDNGIKSRKQYFGFWLRYWEPREKNNRLVYHDMYDTNLMSKYG